MKNGSDKLAEITQPLLDLLITNAYCVWSSQLIGADIPSVHQRFEMIKNPRPGDLVMEVSTIGFREHDRIRIGYLVKVVREKCPVPDGMTDAEYRGEFEPDEELPTETVHYIRLLVDGADGAECRWTNARFIRVVEDRKSFP